MPGICQHILERFPAASCVAVFRDGFCRLDFGVQRCLFHGLHCLIIGTVGNRFAFLRRYRSHLIFSIVPARFLCVQDILLAVFFHLCSRPFRHGAWKHLFLSLTFFGISVSALCLQVSLHLLGGITGNPADLVVLQLKAAADCRKILDNAILRIDTETIAAWLRHLMLNPLRIRDVYLVIALNRICRRIHHRTHTVGTDFIKSQCARSLAACQRVIYFLVCGVISGVAYHLPVANLGLEIIGCAIAMFELKPRPGIPAVFRMNRTPIVHCLRKINHRPVMRGL